MGGLLLPREVETIDERTVSFPENGDTGDLPTQKVGDNREARSA